MNEKKKKSFSFIKFLFSLIFFLILIVALWIAFSAFHKKSALSVFPNNFSVFAHTDSFWDAVNPLLDLPAVESLLSEKPLSDYRSLFMNIRSSSLRGNSFIKASLKRKIDVALYPTDFKSDDFLACIDLGFLSAITRLSNIVGPKIFVENLTFRENENFSYFEYKTEGTSIFAKPVSNLLVASNSLPLLTSALLVNHEDSYNKEERQLLSEKSDEPFRIVADTKRLALQFAKGNDTAEALCTLLKDNKLSVISFGITESDISIKADFPFSTENSKSSLAPLIEKDSTLPALLTRLPDVVQYYTLLNVGTLEELKDALFPIIQKRTDVSSIWNRAQGLCKTLFSESIENILFSWTGKECAVLGIEGSNDPVFVLQITDEQKRIEMFDAIFSSFAIENNTNLILQGIRIPRLDLPPIIRGLLSAFGVNLPRQYYFAHDQYIYFSESPQNLVSLYNSSRAKEMLSGNESWKKVSKDKNALSTASMYYNLERSVPFFIKKGTTFANILEHYKMGRCDFKIKGENISLQLNAIQANNVNSKNIAGFPIDLSGRSNYILHQEPGKNSGAIFWIENNRVIKSLECDSMNQNEYTLPENAYIVAAENKCEESGVLWAVTENGAVYLFKRNLEEVSSFPVLTGEKPSAQISSNKKTCVVPCGKKLLIIKDNASYEKIELPLDAEIKSEPSILDDTIAIYEKSFLGSIYLIKSGSVLNESTPFEIDGISFGSPALLKSKDSLYTAFVTQGGTFYLFNDTSLVEHFPIELENVFYVNVVALGNYFFAISEDAILYRIDLEGNVTRLKIPGATSARSAFLSVKNNNLYVCADSNIVYAFTEDFEIVKGFPVAGHGVPAIVDMNGDRKTDVTLLSLDKKLYAWNVR